MNRIAWLLVVPLILVNAAAVWGQAGWASEHIVEPGWYVEWRWTVAVLFAVAVESVGIFLAGMAHAALMADQSSALLRAGSYAVGLLVGLLNYWHFAGDGFSPSAQAVAFGALSSISPWLWSIYSRYRNRDRLAELGQVDARAVKLSTARKFWHPIKSVRVIRHASWVGIIEPDEAVRSWETAAGLTPAEQHEGPVNSAASDELSVQVSEHEETPNSDNGHDPVKVRRARALSALALDHDPREIAAEVGVQLGTLQRWADDNAKKSRLPRGGRRIDGRDGVGETTQELPPRGAIPPADTQP